MAGSPCALPGPNPFHGFKTSPQIIRQAVMLYIRFPLSLRKVEAKTGNGHLRRLLFVGTTSVTQRGEATDTRPDARVRLLLGHKPTWLVTVAIAHKMARTGWAMRMPHLQADPRRRTGIVARPLRRLTPGLGRANRDGLAGVWHHRKSGSDHMHVTLAL
jgi:hypothetical protein